MRTPAIAFLLAVLAGCATVAHQELDQLDGLYGKADPARFAQPSAGPAARAAWEKVEPVLATRCVVCHACYDAPCQLKLSSWDGLARGGSKERVYALRLLATQPTRLGIDAQTSTEWRGRGFHPVLNERRATPDAERAGSVMHRLLDLKRKHAPETGVLPADRYDFGLDRAQSCATIEEMKEVEEKNPELGMPYGMPPLSEAEYRALTDWIADGAPYAPQPALAPAFIEQVRRWEEFLNGDSPKQQLMSRYLYEHWFLAHLWFRDLGEKESFELVRSKTAPGRPVELIATVRPYDDPGVPRVYYRLRRMEETIVAKTHMPYALDAARMNWLRELFLEVDYPVTGLPSYEPVASANPFVTFREIPVRSRYRLMLEEAQYTIMGFIKGPVCRGQVALNVIADAFWVTFLDPDLEKSGMTEEQLATALGRIHLPAEDDGDLPLLKWKKYANAEDAWLRTKSEAMSRELTGKRRPSLDMLWDGDGRNGNAVLTIFRHFDSATVVQGLVGEPQSAWVVSYPLLERIHYLLVAGYNVFGTAGHEVTTRLYMDFLRMEGESNFLTLLPEASRETVRDRWYRGVGDDVKRYLLGSKAHFAGETGVVYRSADPLTELHGMLQKRYAPVQSRRYEVRTKGLAPAVRKNLARLEALHGAAVSNLPELTFLTVTGLAGGDRQYTLIHDSARTNISTLLQEAKTRVPDEDTVTLVEGFLGAYPNTFHVVAAKDLGAYVEAIAGLKGEEDYAQLMGRFGIRRTDPRFWSHSDALLAAWRRSAPGEAGGLGYNRYENR
jgi:hypothetical protein